MDRLPSFIHPYHFISKQIMSFTAIVQFKTLQQKLNKLCSQHDELMSLLDIVDYLANLKAMAQNNRSTLNKITALEQSIEEIREAQGTQRAQQQELGIFKLQRFQKNIGQIEQKLQEYNNLLLGFDGSLKKLEQESNHFAHTKSINHVNYILQDMMEKETKSSHISIAAYKNDLSQKIMQTQSMVQMLTANSNDPSINIEGLINKVMKNELQQYDKLAHEISLYRAQFPIPHILPFVSHNYEQIKQQINYIASILNQSSILSPSQLSIVKQEFQTIYFRVRALKEYVLCELLKLYEQESKKLEVSKAEKQVGSMIKELENTLELLQDFVAKAEQPIPSKAQDNS